MFRIRNFQVKKRSVRIPNLGTLGSEESTWCDARDFSFETRRTPGAPLASDVLGLPGFPDLGTARPPRFGLKPGELRGF